MGRGKVEMKKMENRLVTFSKRRKGLLKKAHELAVLCDVEVGVIIFSEKGKLSEYSSPPCSMSDLIRQYDEIISNPQLHKEHLKDQQMLARLTNEKEQLESNLRICMGEGLSSLSVDQLIDLEQHLQLVLSKVRARKDELQAQLLDDLRRKVVTVSCHEQNHHQNLEKKNERRVGIFDAVWKPLPDGAGAGVEHGPAAVAAVRQRRRLQQLQPTRCNLLQEPCIPQLRPAAMVKRGKC